MEIKVCFLLLILSLARGGIEYFPYDLALEWEFLDEETVAFKYHIPKLVYDTWAWAGFGLKFADEEDLSMGHSDLITLQWIQHDVQDRWGMGDYYPKLDTSRGGTQDVFLQDEIETDSTSKTVTYTITRKLDTGDLEFDIPLVKDDPYIIMWAVGQNYQGKPVAHTMWNRGRDFMVFSEDYVDDGTDDYWGDGGYGGSNPESNGALGDLANQLLGGN